MFLVLLGFILIGCISGILLFLGALDENLVGMQYGGVCLTIVSGITLIDAFHKIGLGLGYDLLITFCI